jgi:hypothetical protein
MERFTPEGHRITPEEFRAFSLALTGDEIAALDPIDRLKYEEVQRRLVFGEHYKRDADGKPLEQGIGSPGRENANHYFYLQKERDQRENSVKAILEAVNKD